jgi:hypothetical protein
MNAPRVTIRQATADERRKKFPPIVRDGPRVRVPKYVVVNPENGNVYTVFGLPQGGDTRAEAFFWAERLVSNNGFDYTPPDGWERVRGALKPRLA